MSSHEVRVPLVPELVSLIFSVQVPSEDSSQCLTVLNIQSE